MSVASVIRKPRILVVDDEVAMVRSLELLLRPLGEICKAYSVPEAEDALSKDPKIDCIVTDVSMPEASGLELVDSVRRKFPDLPVIVMTAYSSVPQAVEAIQRGAFEYLVKPFENSEMLSCVKRAISRRGLTTGETKAFPEGWICNSKAMQDFLSKIERVLESPCLLLLGEAGAGKGRAARWIHEQSTRAKKEFIPVDGRTHDEDSALITKSFAKAGTIFIAEVFSLSKRLQDRLLEILKEGKVSVIAASSSSPEIQVAESFRKDLYDRLVAVDLRVPSLAERSEDFEALVREYLKQLTSRLKLQDIRLDEKALARLKAHTYLANLRELEAVLERAAIEVKAGVINEENIRFSNSELTEFLPFSIPVEEGWKKLELLHQSLERELILRALAKYPDSSNTQIASVLGTTRRILELRMKDYHIRET
jgi:two-component system NtrC family response regulator